MAEQRALRAGDDLRPDDLISVRPIRRPYRAGKLLAYRDGNGHGVRISCRDLRRWMTAKAVGPVAEGENLAAATARPVRQVSVSGRRVDVVAGDDVRVVLLRRLHVVSGPRCEIVQGAERPAAASKSPRASLNLCPCNRLTQRFAPA